VTVTADARLSAAGRTYCELLLAVVSGWSDVRPFTVQAAIERLRKRTPFPIPVEDDVLVDMLFRGKSMSRPSFLMLLEAQL
jgi:hypothetical protein